MGPLTAEIMLDALVTLDQRLEGTLKLLMGGGGAMILAHGFPIGTTDIDAIPRGLEPADLDRLTKQIAIEKNLPHDWLNPYFASFTHTLPADYGTRLKTVFSGTRLTVDALGAEDMLVMKCFAHRQKDVGHAKCLIKIGSDSDFVRKHFESLRRKKIPGVDAAEEFLDDVLDQMDGSHS